MAREPEQWLLDHKDYPHEYCLIWPFARESRVGRGMMGDSSGKRKWAHRCMCELIHGPAPIDKPQAVHSCGNGDQGCVNPRHLSWGTNSQNQLDRSRHGRGATGKQHKFTPEQIAKMRSQYGEFTQTKLAEMYGCSLGTIQYYLKYREERGHAGGKVIHWTPIEEETLRAGVAAGLNFNQIAKQIGKKHHTVSSKAYRLGLKSGTPPIPSRSLSASNGRE